MPTSGVDLLIAAWRQLDDAERDAVYEALTALRLDEQAGADSEAARLIASLRRVCEHLDGAPSAAEYRAVSSQLRTDGEPIASLREQVAHWGTWARAKEALLLSDTQTARRIEARFRSRTIGKVWKYTEAVLRDTLGRAIAEHERVPSVAEFDWWRERQLQLASARGEQLHLPSATPYRKRWGSWQGALRHFGYDDAQADERFQQS